MPFPELIASTESVISREDADALGAVIIALGPISEIPQETSDVWPGLVDALTAVGFTGKRGSTTRVFVPTASGVPLVAAGLGSEVTPAAVRDAIGAAVRVTTGFDALGVVLPAETDAELWTAAAEGAALGGYSFDSYKSKKGPARAASVTLFAGPALTDEALERVRATASAVALVKDLTLIPAEDLGPSDFAERAVAEAEGLPIAVEVLDEQALQSQGYGGVWGVGKGSDRPPRVVRLTYAPDGAARTVALVGKGITFDTGGLSLKPPASMVGMKFDMAGAATVLAVVTAAARLGLPVSVDGWLCIADNMPSGRATRPGDVVTILDGTTVEVLNTDAEGRLVLADGLVAASRTSPDLIVDVATLTGGISIALGTRHMGVMGEDAAVEEFLDAARAAGELAWPLPLPDYMEDELDSPIADLRNAKIGDSAGGSLFAGLFLRRFVGRVGDGDDAPRIPWVHLDIAGAAELKAAPYGSIDKGPTAVPVRSLLALLSGAGA